MAKVKINSEVKVTLYTKVQGKVYTYAKMKNKLQERRAVLEKHAKIGL